MSFLQIHMCGGDDFKMSRNGIACIVLLHNSYNKIINIMIGTLYVVQNIVKATG